MATHYETLGIDPSATAAEIDQAYRFLAETYGRQHPLTKEARKRIKDERTFSVFLNETLERLEGLYGSSATYEEKLAAREKVFQDTLAHFKETKEGLQTARFVHFGRSPLNNAYLLAVSLYHRRYGLFESLMIRKGGSLRATLDLLKNLSRGKGDMLERMEAWLDAESGKPGSAGRVAPSAPFLSRNEPVFRGSHGDLHQAQGGAKQPESGESDDGG